MYFLCSFCIVKHYNTGKVRDRFGGMDRFKGGLGGKGRVNSIIIAVITEIKYRCNHTRYYFKYKYNVKHVSRLFCGLLVICHQKMAAMPNVSNFLMLISLRWTNQHKQTGLIQA